MRIPDRASRLVEQLRPDNPLAHAPYLLLPYSLSTTSGIAALNAEVTRQAQMVAYIDDFKLMMVVAFLGHPFCCCCTSRASRALPAPQPPSEELMPSPATRIVCDRVVLSYFGRPQTLAGLSQEGGIRQGVFQRRRTSR